MAWVASYVVVDDEGYYGVVAVVDCAGDDDENDDDDDGNVDVANVVYDACCVVMIHPAGCLQVVVLLYPLILKVSSQYIMNHPSCMIYLY